MSNRECSGYICRSLLTLLGIPPVRVGRYASQLAQLNALGLQHINDARLLALLEQYDGDVHEAANAAFN